MCKNCDALCSICGDNAWGFDPCAHCRITCQKEEKMPLYSYLCKTCDLTSAITRSIHDPEVIPTCLKCDKPMVRQYSTPAVSFKGSGFYITDKGNK